MIFHRGAAEALVCKADKLAKELNLPIIVHDRDAHKDVLDIVKAEQAKDVGGVFHCYREVLRCLRMCWKTTFTFQWAEH